MLHNATRCQLCIFGHADATVATSGGRSQSAVDGRVAVSMLLLLR